MKTIADIQKEYSGKIDRLDLDLIMGHVLKKPREFVMTHPEHKINPNYGLRITDYVRRRQKHEPIAHILGHKEFFGLDFKVTPDTLIPRPETELLVEGILKMDPKGKNVIDVGTGSGNIIISLAKNISGRNSFFAVDISKKALTIARHNAKLHKVDKKIKFLHGNLLDRIKNFDNSIIIANLPYLSKEIYAATLPNVKKYEPKSALYSPKEGLGHYEKLMKQLSALQKCYMFHATCYMEISPEQKARLPKIIRKHLPQAKVAFIKDLANKWRLCRIEI